MTDDREALRKRMNALDAGITASLEQAMGGEQMRPMYRDEDGTPIGLGDWLLKRREGGWLNLKTRVGEGIEVSTVWLGMDHGFLAEAPLIFETMVFVALDEPIKVWGITIPNMGTECRRYTTREQAVKGHEDTVAELRSNLP